MERTDVCFRMHLLNIDWHDPGNMDVTQVNLIPLRSLQPAQQLLFLQFLGAFWCWVCCGVLRNCSSVAQSADVALMCCCCRAFCHFRGSSNTLWYPLQHLDALCYADGGGFLGTALLGFSLSGILWNGTVCVCACAYSWVCLKKKKWGCTGWPVNGQAKDTKGEKQYLETWTVRDKESWMTERSATHTLQLSRGPCHQFSPLRLTGGVCQVN